jgi:hypothetical protein
MLYFEAAVCVSRSAWLLPEAGDSGKGNALACVARALRDAETLRERRNAKSRETLFRVVAGLNTA